MRPSSEGLGDETTGEAAARARAELDGVRRQIEALEHAHAPAARSPRCAASSTQLEGRVCARRDDALARGTGRGAKDGADLPGPVAPRSRYLRAELYAAAQGGARQARSKRARALAKDAVNRLEPAASRLLRRARLGRIESVLGRKRALEVEVEALASGVLPQAALDSLEAPRYLKDSEEYWPFEGDDWPDEYVGGEGLR